MYKELDVIDMREYLDDMNEVYLEVDEDDEYTLDMLDATMYSIAVQLGWDIVQEES